MPDAPIVTIQRFAPALGWTLAGAVAFPALMLSNSPAVSPLAPLAVVIGGVGIAVGAAVAARGRGDSERTAAIVWAVAYAAAVILYLIWPVYSMPADAYLLEDNHEDAYRLVQFLVVLFMTPVIGGGIEGALRSPWGRMRSGGVASACVWALGALPLPILIVIGIYVAHIFGVVITVAGGKPGVLLGMIYSGALMGLAVGAAAERLSRGMLNYSRA